MKSLWILGLAGLMVLSGCGGGTSQSTQSRAVAPLAGNWQFTMSNPSDDSFLGGLQGGFLLQDQSSVSGGIVYSVSLPGSQTSCNSGSAATTGTISGKSVTLNAAAGAQNFTLTGTLSADGSTMIGTYSSTDGQGCGTAQTGLQWSALYVPPMTGEIHGSFHSVTSNAHLSNQDFPVTGMLTQGENIGASNATVTGWVNFDNYPCLASASINGQISGTSAILQLIGSNGLNAGQIGAAPGFTNPSPVVFESSAQGGGYILHGINGYGVTTKPCPGGNLPGDLGNICVALGNSTSCTQPISLTPAALVFPAEVLGSRLASQTITITNTDPAAMTLSGLTLTFQPQTGTPSPFGLSDFTGLPNFTEQDTCSSPTGSPFSLDPQENCVVTIFFSPQQSCPWLPSVALGGAAPSQCPLPLTAMVTVNSPTSADGNKAFAVPITGTGLSAIVPVTPEVDFGAEALTEASEPQVLSFINQGSGPVQILPALSQVCVNPASGILTLNRPLAPGVIAGLQVDSLIIPDPPTIDYLCDSDLTSQVPNFQISSDSCSGAVLNPLGTCSVAITFAPQPATPLNAGLDYFLELNTLQCTSDVTSNCEIDSGRFPVELKANPESPLRMSPGAGVDFGLQPKGQTSLAMRVTLFNDPNDPNARTVDFTGNVLKGDFFERDDCGASLAPGGSCTFSITFTPNIIGFDSGRITISYAVGQTQTIYLRGIGCVLGDIGCLGTGQ